MRRRTGLIFRPSRHSAFEAGLVRAMRQAQLTNPEVYLARLDDQPKLLDDLVGEITVGETYFFREPEQVAVIRDEVLPDLVSNRPRHHALRIWSAGCATGEEAYTLAIIVRECGLREAAHIVATDLSRTALAAAPRGLYSRWSLRGVSDQVIATYFEWSGQRFRLMPAVREAVEFRYLNLAEDVYPSLSTGIWGMDLILCRNVLIYFDAATVAWVARRLIDCLSDKGWLLLGASDPPIGDLVPCDVVVTDAGLAYRRPGRAAPPRVTAELTPTLSHARPPEGLPPRQSPPPPVPPRGPAPVVPEQGSGEGAANAADAYSKRNYERAAELARRSVQLGGSDPAPWIVLVRALANQGELAAAGQACAAALDRHRTCAELAYLHAVLLAEAGRHHEAVGAARRALYLDRGLVVAHLLLGATRARLGDRDNARRAVQNAQRLLDRLAPEDIVPASDGEPAGRLAEMTRVQIQLLGGAAA